MLYWSVGKVIGSVTTRERVQEVIVKIGDNAVPEKAIHYTDVFPPLAAEDVVLLNSTAMKLRLGSGGFHIVYAVLHSNSYEGEQWNNPERFRRIQANDKIGYAPGHMIKLRYTPMQRAVLAAEEEASPYHELFCESRSLNGMPVLIGELHSMLPITMAWLRGERKEGRKLRVVYIMTDGGALPIAWSRHVSTLKELGWIDGTVTYGHAYGGDLEVMNKFTALIAAKYILQADIAVVVMGPGIAGTGTLLGNTAVEVGEIVNAVSSLQGAPVVIPRISFADQRPRHHGLSHHLLTALSTLIQARAYLPIAESLPSWQKLTIRNQLTESGCLRLTDLIWVPEVKGELVRERLSAYPERITTMGRGVIEDESFFVSVCAAAEFALSLLTNENGG